MCSFSFGNPVLTIAHKWFSRPGTQRGEHTAVLLRNILWFSVSWEFSFSSCGPSAPFPFRQTGCSVLFQLLTIFQFLMKSLFGLDLPACKLNSGNCTKIRSFVWADPKARIFQVNMCPGVMTIPDESLDSSLRCDPPTNRQQLSEKYCYSWIKNSL